MNTDHRIYKKSREHGFNEYRKQLENWRIETEATRHSAGTSIPLDNYGQPGQFFTSSGEFTELCLTGRGNTYHVITGPQSNGWFIYIPALNVLCAVPDPEDFLSNKFYLNKAMGSLDALSIAEGVCAYVQEARQDTTMMC